MSATKSRCLVKVGFDIDPNQVCTNFNKKNQIGFKLKLLKNLRNAKKSIEKFEDTLYEETNLDEIQEPKIIEKNENKNSKFLNNEIMRKRNNSLNPLNSNRDQCEITDRYMQNAKPREKSMSSRNVIKIQNTKCLNNISNIINEGDNDIVSPSHKKRINKDQSGNVKLHNNYSNNNIFQMTKLIDNIDSFVEINTDLSAYVNSQCSIDEETKIIDIWIDYETCLKENKSCKQNLIKLLLLFQKCFTYEKSIFKNEFANKHYYKLIKLMISITVASLFVIIYVGYDLNIKNSLIKLAASVSKPLMHIYEFFGVKNLCKNISDEFLEKLNKFVLKYYKFQKSQVKNLNILVYLSKEIDNAGLALKQYSK